MRKGKILSMDFADGHGTIEDDNEQQIEFSLLTLHTAVSVFDEVQFEIVMSVRGLIAVDLRYVSQPIG